VWRVREEIRRGRRERRREREREREKRPEDEESISCARKRTYVGTRRSGKKKEKERTVHSERKKEGQSWVGKREKEIL